MTYGRSTHSRGKLFAWQIRICISNLRTGFAVEIDMLAGGEIDERLDRAYSKGSRG